MFSYKERHAMDGVYASIPRDTSSEQEPLLRSVYRLLPTVYSPHTLLAIILHLSHPP